MCGFEGRWIHYCRHSKCVYEREKDRILTPHDFTQSILDMLLLVRRSVQLLQGANFTNGKSRYSLPLVSSFLKDLFNNFLCISRSWGRALQRCDGPNDRSFADNEQQDRNVEFHIASEDWTDWGLFRYFIQSQQVPVVWTGECLLTFHISCKRHTDSMTCIFFSTATIPKSAWSVHSEATAIRSWCDSLG